MVPNAVSIRGSNRSDILAIPVRGSGIDMELKNIARGIVIFRAIGHLVQITATILTQQVNRVERLVVIAKNDHVDPFDMLLPGRGDLDYIDVEITGVLGSNIYETWPKCLRQGAGVLAGSWVLAISINRQHVRSVFVRLALRTKIDEPEQQYVMALWLGHPAIYQEEVIRFDRVLQWHEFSRLAKSWAGLLAYFPRLKQASEWPPASKSIANTHVIISKVGVGANKSTWYVATYC